LVYYKDDETKTYTTKEGLILNNIKSLLFDSKGQLWIGTYGGGLSLFNKHGFTNFTAKDSLLHNYIHNLFEDSKGNIWIGSGLGLQKFDGKRFYNFDARNNL
jgi:ligand-binding sensor domain-containing protein